MAAPGARAGGLRHLPNVLTGLRLLAAPWVFWLLIEQHYRLAAVLTAAAMFTDLLDGYLARRFAWQSRLGGWLDPLADKLMMAACFVGLSLAGAVPLPLTALVLLRDVVLVAGAAAYHRWVARLQAEPSWLGKTCTAVQSLYVLLLLVDLGLDRASSRGSELAVWVVAGWVLASGIDYVVRWSRRARKARLQQGEAK